MRKDIESLQQTQAMSSVRSMIASPARGPPAPTAQSQFQQQQQQQQQQHASSSASSRSSTEEDHLKKMEVWANNINILFILS